MGRCFGISDITNDLVKDIWLCCLVVFFFLGFMAVVEVGLTDVSLTIISLDEPSTVVLC